MARTKVLTPAQKRKATMDAKKTPKVGDALVNPSAILTGIRNVQLHMNTVHTTLQQRGNRYGDFTDHARLSRGLVKMLERHTPAQTPERGHPQPWDNLSAVQQQALVVICDKLARILNGDPNYDDNWHDIQGYAKLVEDRLPK